MLPPEIFQLFARQHGMLANYQLFHLSNADRRRVREHPEVECLTPRVLRHRCAAQTSHQLTMAAVLDGGPGSALWGKSSATSWGFGRFRSSPTHVARQRVAMRGRRLGQMHLVADLSPGAVTSHLDIPTARPELTILWLAGMLTHRYGHEVGAQRLGVVLDQAWRQRLINGQYLHDLVARSGGKGRSGIVLAREALETRPPDYQPAGSRLEERYEEVLSHRVRSVHDRQVTVDAEVVIRTVDYRVRTWPLIVEINGEAFHSSITDRRADDERYRRLLDLGFSVVVWWEYDVWHDPDTIRRTMTSLIDNSDASPTLHRPTPAPWTT